MPKFDYVQMRDQVVTPLLRQFGAEILMHRIEDTDMYERRYDPVTMSNYWFNTETEERYDEKPEAVQRTYTAIGVIQSFDIKDIDGTMVQQDDLMLTLIGDPTPIPKPKAGDIFEAGGVEYKFLRLRRTAPANIDVVYRVQVRV